MSETPLKETEEQRQLRLQAANRNVLIIVSCVAAVVYIAFFVVMGVR